MQEKFKELASEQILCSAAEVTLSMNEVKDSPSLTIKVTDDEELQSLNLQYRGIDKPTDVLSFPADFTDPDLDSRYLGDVVISFPRAEEQAQKRGHKAEEEIQLLIIHGVLHLLGFDHGQKEDKDLMWSKQSQIMKKIGLSIEVEDK